ncbi:hypothetical protein R1flu_009586 [Riccia fluitans]|uniref:Uncharacterized protein n=1 Tax=Riccia fluitans TaxID=41844 RepID=A0ABD1Z2I0_9MARC
MLQELDLSDNFIDGVMPQELGRLEHLTILRLGGRTLLQFFPWIPSMVMRVMLSGSIPQELGQLQNLMELDLSRNALSGSIPRVLSNCSNLYFMSLEGNNLTGSIPTSITNCRNQLQGTIPIEFQDSQNLAELSLGYNLLRGKIPNFSSPNLWWLSLDNNQLTGEIPPFNSTELKYLHLGNNSLSGEIPLFILPNLRELALSFNHLTGSIPVSFYANIPNLTILSLANNFLSGGLVLDFGDYANCSLQFLLIAGNNFSGTFPGSIQLCQELKVLDVSRNGLFGRLPLSASNAPQLIVLLASSNKFEGEIPSWVWQLEQLQILDLSDNNFHGGMPLRFDGLLALKGEGATNLSARYISEDDGPPVVFDTEISYKGNEGLCGQPSNRSCSVAVGSSVTPVSSDSSPSFLSEWISLPAFSIGFGLGYCIIGLMLLFSKRFRYSFFRFLPFPRVLKLRKPISYGVFRYQ